MFHPITTSLQVAYHDAWLQEMQKEPGPRVGQPARLGVRGRLLMCLSSRLVSTGLRLRARYTIEMPPGPEVAAHSSGVTAS
jgi:hypothetical protein